MQDLNNQRKMEHLSILEKDTAVDRKKAYFDCIQLSHRALPEIDFQDTDPSIEFMGKRLTIPLLISSMTGGDQDLLKTINKNLAIAASATGVAMGVGSQRVMFSNPSSKQSFTIRSYAPDALLFANLGAVQLNNGFTLPHCQDAIDVLQADALCLHLNPLQERIQPEGNINFSGLAKKISTINDSLNVPVILKEVGAGISPSDAELAIANGIQYIDVAGTGGISWSRIEAQRRHNRRQSLGLQFQDWGIPTPLALQLLQPYRDRCTLIASGGIRNGIDMLKALCLGAELCGMASPFLRAAMESAERVIQLIEAIKAEFRTAMFLLGVTKTRSLIGNERLLLSNPYKEQSTLLNQSVPNT